MKRFDSDGMTLWLIACEAKKKKQSEKLCQRQRL